MSESIRSQGEDPGSQARIDTLAKLEHLLSQPESMSLGEIIVESEKPTEINSFYTDNTLPTRFARESYDMRKCLELYGIVFGDPIPGNDEFTEAILPEGWSKVQHKHPMWVRIMDDKSIERGLIFWKRGLNGNPPEVSSVIPRYRMYLEDAQGDDLIGASIVEDDKVVYRTQLHSTVPTKEMLQDAARFAKYGDMNEVESVTSTKRLRRSYIVRVAEAEALEWVEENHPEWADIVENFPVRSRAEHQRWEQQRLSE